jgi:hypothetical protein
LLGEHGHNTWWTSTGHESPYPCSGASSEHAIIDGGMKAGMQDIEPRLHGYRFDTLLKLASNSGCDMLAVDGRKLQVAQ